MDNSSLAIVFGLVSGVGWASAIVATRIVIKKTDVPDELGAFYSVVVAGLTAFLVAVLTSFGFSDFIFSWSIIGNLVIVGLVSPGLSQLTYFTTIRSIGPSRAGIFIGTAPVFSVLGAVIFSDGRLTTAVGLGTLTVVFGGALMSTEKTTEQLKILGVVTGFTTAFLFGARDVISNDILVDEGLNSAFVAGLQWLSGGAAILAFILLKRALFAARSSGASSGGSAVANPFFKKSYLLLGIPGFIQGLSLSALLEAFKQGRVEISAPISNSVASILTIVIAFALLGQGEWNRKIGVSMLAVVAGAVAIGVWG